MTKVNYKSEGEHSKINRYVEACETKSISLNNSAGTKPGQSGGSLSCSLHRELSNAPKNVKIEAREEKL